MRTVVLTFWFSVGGLLRVDGFFIDRHLFYRHFCFYLLYSRTRRLRSNGRRLVGWSGSCLCWSAYVFVRFECSAATSFPVHDRYEFVFSRRKGGFVGLFSGVVAVVGSNTKLVALLLRSVVVSFSYATPRFCFIFVIV